MRLLLYLLRCGLRGLLLGMLLSRMLLGRLLLLLGSRLQLLL